MKGDAAALFHFLLPLNKKFLFQTYLLFGEEIGYFPVPSATDSFVDQLIEIPALSLQNAGSGSFFPQHSPLLSLLERAGTEKTRM